MRVRRVVLVRHTEVARAWRGRCYGRSDVGLSRAGTRAARDLVDQWTGPVDAIVHSGSRRAAILAGWLGARLGIAPVIDFDWRERDFGAWEGLSWTAIWRATGPAMDGMLTAPDTFRPGGGETTRNLVDRAARAWARLPDGDRVVVVAHGGPIAAVRLMQGRAAIGEIAAFIPAPGSITDLCRDAGAVVD
ncbi:histidine phosphatase family protein [Polymorphobacter sp. PAMC 29334]|nr:histidine phosphatase family protein [Polymorphobacter sp. PAMC 29334]